MVSALNYNFLLQFLLKLINNFYNIELKKLVEFYKNNIKILKYSALITNNEIPNTAIFQLWISTELTFEIKSNRIFFWCDLINDFFAMIDFQVWTTSNIWSKYRKKGKNWRV